MNADIKINTQQLQQAIKVAVNAHTTTLDANGVLYIFHPLRVMVMAQALGLDDEHQAVAVLHDVVEDTEMTLTALATAGFSPRVIAGVASLTRAKGKNAGNVGGDETYMEFVARAARNPIARKIKPLDNADNMRPERKKPGNDFKLPARYQKALRYLMNANAIAGDLDYIIAFNRLHPWAALNKDVK